MSYSAANKETANLTSDIGKTDETNGLHNRVNGEHANDPKESTRIPLLEEIFKLFPDMPINIDIKFNSDELIRKVSRLFAVV